MRQNGFSLIEILIVVIILGIIAAIAIPSLLASRRAANEAAAISNLRNLHTTETIYFKENNVFATLANLSGAGLMDSTWTGTPTKTGYLYELTLGAGIAGYCVTSTATAASEGNYSYAVSHHGVIYRMDGQTAPTCNASTGNVTGDGTLIAIQ